MTRATFVCLGLLFVIVCVPWLVPAVPVAETMFPIVVTRAGSIGSSLPDTGVYRCANATANGVLCPGIGEAFYGQDAHYNPPARTPRVTDNGDGTVSDQVTGLMWMRDALIGGGSGFSWSAAQTECTSQTLAGHSDWRTPSIGELMGLARFDRVEPSVHPMFLPHDNIDYWSSTPSAINDTQAWYVYSYNGQIGIDGKATARMLRCVRGASSSSASLRRQGEVVTDASTGLVWAQADNGVTVSWEAALAWCESFSLDGRGDWRMPDVKELWTILDLERSSDPLLDTSVFQGVSDYYWTGSPCAWTALQVWSLDFGRASMAITAKTYPCRVRCVRGGP